jgi:hypothetical protein
MKTPKLIMVALTSFILFSGCAMEQRIAQTPSGRPEVVIDSNDMDLVKSSIINEMQTANYQLQNDSQYRLAFTKQLEGGQGFMAQLLLGNSYSTPPIAEVSFNLSKQASKIKVMEFSSISTQMAFGQVNRGDMKDNNAWFNGFYLLLQRVKTTAEKDNKVIAALEEKPAKKESGVYSIEVRP